PAVSRLRDAGGADVGGARGGPARAGGRDGPGSAAGAQGASCRKTSRADAERRPNNSGERPGAVMNRGQRRAPRKGSDTATGLSAAGRRLFDSAVAQLRTGALDAAEQSFRRVLADRPDHADSLHLLGSIAWHTDRADLAFDLISKAVARDPNNA